MNSQAAYIPSDTANYVLDTLPDGVVIVDSNRDILFANKNIESMLGFSPKEILGQKVEKIMPERFRSEHEKSLERYALKPLTRQMGAALGTMALHKNGHEIHVDIKLSPLRWEGKQVYLSIIRDVEHIKSLEDRLNEHMIELETTIDKLNQVSEEKNMLLGIAAHDLRNPLSSIYSFSELILEDLSLSAEIRLFADKIAQISRFSLELVADILDVSALESGKVQLHLSRFDVTRTIRNGLETWRVAAKRKNIKIVEEFQSGLPQVLADESKIYQIVENLITNAIKYSPLNTQIAISLSLSSHKNVLIKVKDQGPGISESVRARLFDPFFTAGTQATGGEKSTGLGLAIVKKIVEAHRGKVWLESQVGQGATFFVELPQGVDPS